MNKKAYLLALISFYIFIVTPLTPVLAQELKLPADTDRIPPIIEHKEKSQTAPSGTLLIIQATATDNVAIKEVILYYRVMGNVEYFSVNMNPKGDNTYSATIPSRDVLEPGVEYYIQASDKAGNMVLRGFSFSPLLVSVAPVLPTIEPATRGTEGEGPPLVEAPPSKGPVLKTEAKPKAWYQKGWVWGIVGGVVIVAAVAGRKSPDRNENVAGAPTFGDVTISGPLP